MVDIDDGVDEDYLIAARADAGPGLRAQVFVRKPTTWVARHLRQQGAMVMYGILVGYAGIFAAHISKYWPGLTNVLTRVIAAASSTDDESRFSASIIRGVPSIVLRSLRWRPPVSRQRAFRLSLRLCFAAVMAITIAFSGSVAAQNAAIATASQASASPDAAHSSSATQRFAKVDS